MTWINGVMVAYTQDDMPVIWEANVRAVISNADDTEEAEQKFQKWCIDNHAYVHVYFNTDGLPEADEVRGLIEYARDTGSDMIVMSPVREDELMETI